MNMKLAALVIVALLGCGAVHADTLLIDKLDTTAAVRADRPGRGMTMARVETKFGAPMSRRGAVGDPPISSWEYADFTVFFEYDRVLHAVDKPVRSEG
jgi:hypothetical protein